MLFKDQMEEGLIKGAEEDLKNFRSYYLKLRQNMYFLGLTFCYLNPLSGFSEIGSWIDKFLHHFTMQKAISWKDCVGFCPACPNIKRRFSLGVFRIQYSLYLPCEFFLTPLHDWLT